MLQEEPRILALLSSLLLISLCFFVFFFTFTFHINKFSLSNLQKKKKIRDMNGVQYPAQIRYVRYFAKVKERWNPFQSVAFLFFWLFSCRHLYVFVENQLIQAPPNSLCLDCWTSLKPDWIFTKKNSAASSKAISFYLSYCYAWYSFICKRWFVYTCYPSKIYILQGIIQCFSILKYRFREINGLQKWFKSTRAFFYFFLLFGRVVFVWTDYLTYLSIFMC